MAADALSLLLTGAPGCGKTTVIRRVIENLTARRLAGFYTRELREAGRRVGFEAVGLGGVRAPLAHVDGRSPLRVGKYAVELADFEPLVQQELDRPRGDVDLYVIDEIGKMECFSPIFVDAVRRILAGPTPLLATIALHGGGFIREVKQRPDIELLTVTLQNRDRLPDELTARLLAGAANQQDQGRA